MSKIDQLLDEVWAETGTDAGGAAPGVSARSGQEFSLTVMEAIARRRLRTDLAMRFAVVVALFAVAWGLAPVVTPLMSEIASAQGRAALTLFAALTIGLVAQQWVTGRVRV